MGSPGAYNHKYMWPPAIHEALGSFLESETAPYTNAWREFKFLPQPGTEET